MMVAPWLARPLRRFVGTAVMMVGGQAFIHGLLHPGPEMPPAGADRVRVMAPEGEREISDPETVERIAEFVRARRAPFARVSGDRDHFWGMRSVCFSRGSSTYPCVRFSDEAMIIHARHDVLIYRLTPAQVTRLQALVEAASR